MIRARSAFLQSRVGKRVFFLFVISALAPLGVMAALSLTQVRELLIDQGKTRLAALAKNYALSVYERMLTARDGALLIAAQPARATPLPVAGPLPVSANIPSSSSLANQFRFLGRVDAIGRVEAIKGNAPPEAAALVAEYRGMAVPPPTLLRSTAGEKLFILENHPRTTAAGAIEHGVLVGELNPAYVWGDESDMKSGMIICVVDSANMQYVNCHNGRELGLPRLLADAGPNHEPTDVVWSREGVDYRGRVWAQFLKNDFGAKDWYFAISLPEDDLLAAVYTFRRSFVLVVGLALLLIVWFSSRQIRAILTPLGHLTAATRHIAANDFSARVEVNSADEFGELGGAFNSMSGRLGRQSQIARAHADIDQMILGREDLKGIVEAMLRQLQVLMPEFRVLAVLLDRIEPALGRQFSLDGELSGVGTNALKVDSVPVPPSTRPDLSIPMLTLRKSLACEPDWARPSGGADMPPTATQWIYPLVWGQAACGWLLIIAPDANVISDDERRMISDLAGRLALAVASVWRDDELYQQAHYDSLTGLPNRLLFGDRLQRELARGKRESRTSAVLFVDLDHFKAVNDSQGHGAGDFLLCEAARRIASAIRESDTVSRHGGDEFTVLLSDIHEHQDALRVGDAIVAALSKPFTVAGQDCFLSASVGIAIHPDNGLSVEELLKNADTAMYRAKAAGRGQSMFYEERMNAAAISRITIDRELRHALEHGELELFYQPQVSMVNDRVEAAEALIRWNHPRRGLLGPGQFIAVAEESGLINAIGRWVIEEAARQIVAWRRDGFVIERLSVNVSARQFREPDFVEHIHVHVIAPGLASSIEFEITESAMLERMDLLEEKLKVIADAGSTIALDDFGTGFSSMAYLKKLTVHVVKIDRAFVEDIDKSAESLAFVEAIIAMAHALGKTVIAEGVENDEQVRLLGELGCDLLQGYRFSKPLPGADFVAYSTTFGRS